MLSSLPSVRAAAADMLSAVPGRVVRALSITLEAQLEPPASAGGRPALLQLASLSFARLTARGHSATEDSGLGSQGLRSNFSRNALKMHHKNEGCLFAR